MKKEKPFRVACYMRVGTKEQIDYDPITETAEVSPTESPKENTAEEAGDEHLVQQTMETTY